MNKIMHSNNTTAKAVPNRKERWKRVRERRHETKITKNPLEKTHQPFKRWQQQHQQQHRPIKYYYCTHIKLLYNITETFTQFFFSSPLCSLNFFALKCLGRFFLSNFINFALYFLSNIIALIVVDWIFHLSDKFHCNIISFEENKKAFSYSQTLSLSNFRLIATFLLVCV